MKVKNSIRSAISISFMIISGICSAQSPGIQDIKQKLELYKQKYPEEIVYVQTDRTNYSPGEVIRFNAYIIYDIGNRAETNSQNLFFKLIDIDTLDIISKVFKTEKNQASGIIEIPLKVSSGTYKLIAYTSWMKNSPIDRVFSKDIIIEKEIRKGFIINISLKDTVSQPGSQLTAYLEFKGNDSSPVSSNYVYRLTGADGTIIEGEGKTDKSGKAVVNLTLPSFVAGNNLKLLIDAGSRNNKTSSGIVIPTPDNYIDVKFYPEGGVMVYGAESKIAFRAFNEADRPVDFKGELFASSGTLVKKIESTYQGVGSFSLNPEKGMTYYMKVTEPSGISKTFELPAPRISGTLLSVSDKIDGTLTMDINQVNKSAQVINFIAQVKGNIYWSESREISGHTQISVPLDKFPSGIAELTAFDNSGNLIAKRLVLINENKKLKIEIRPDKQQYNKGERVSLTIIASDENGNPVEADLSLAAINKELKNIPDNNDIFTYLNLRSNLIGYIPSPMFYFENNKTAEEVLDNILIANAFSRFTWQRVLNTKQADASYTKFDEENDSVPLFNFGRDYVAYISHDLRNSLMSPGKSYTVQDANDMIQIMNLNKPVRKEIEGYEPGISIMDVIYSIKPYEYMNGEIVFSGVGVNSINWSGGAGIVIDGMHAGTNPSVLTQLNITDISKINVYVNPIDIQRFTGLNSMGIIEVLTKRANSGSENKESVGSDIFYQNPGSGISQSTIKSKSDKRSTVYWNPDIRTDKSGKAVVTYLNEEVASDVVITAEGTGKGLAGSAEYSYTVK